MADTNTGKSTGTETGKKPGDLFGQTPGGIFRPKLGGLFGLPRHPVGQSLPRKPIRTDNNEEQKPWWKFW